jgi:hypothetical protein
MLTHEALWELTMARFTMMVERAASTTMIVIVTNNSTSVKPFLRLREGADLKLSYFMMTFSGFLKVWIADSLSDYFWMKGGS